MGEVAWRESWDYKRESEATREIIEGVKQAGGGVTEGHFRFLGEQAGYLELQRGREGGHFLEGNRKRLRGERLL